MGSAASKIPNLVKLVLGQHDAQNIPEIWCGLALAEFTVAFHIFPWLVKGLGNGICNMYSRTSQV